MLDTIMALSVPMKLVLLAGVAYVVYVYGLNGDISSLKGFFSGLINKGVDAANTAKNSVTHLTEKSPTSTTDVVQKYEDLYEVIEEKKLYNAKPLMNDMWNSLNPRNPDALASPVNIEINKKG